MADSQPSANNDKNKKNRGLGAFLLFLTILVAVLVAMGPENYRQRRELSQDEYELNLYRGNVQTQEFRGNNLIEGKLRGSDQAQAYFKVEYADVTPVAERFRSVKALESPEIIYAKNLLEGVRESWYRPVLVRTLSLIESKAAPAGTVPKGPEATPATKQTSELYVRVTAIGAASFEDLWRERQPGSAAPLDDFPMPSESGNLYLQVMGVDDLGATVSALAAAGAQVEHLAFDTSGGTRHNSTDSFFGSLLLIWGPWILIFVVFMFFMRQMRSQGGAGGVMSFGRSRAQLYSKESHTNVTFDDVAGAVEAKDEVREIVEFLKNPSRFTRIGGRIPRGVLLVGPPGCGKTLLAKAIAGEAEVPFFSISGSDFVEMFVGVGASRVRDLFKQARENSPCIIFLDEIDAVGRRRGSGLGGGHDEREQTLNAILVEMDGFGTDEGIIVVAATNRPDVLDPALLRPGRFDREVVIDLPDAEGRKQILKVHLQKVKHGKDVNLDTLARSTPGYSGADLAAIINEAAIRAALDKREEICQDDLEEARDKVRYGRQKKSRKLEEVDRRITAYHEAGHAIVATQIEDIEKPHKVTIVPRGRALGATMVLPDKESYHMQRNRMRGQLAMLFGGRVAEAEFCGDISAGASDDIRRATELARAMVTELGMSDKIGPVNYAEREGSDFLGTELMRGRLHSEDTARQIDEEVQVILREAYDRAVSIVRENREHLAHLAEALLRYETLDGVEIDKLLRGTPVESLRPAPGLAPLGGQPGHAGLPKDKPSPAPEKGLRGDLPGLSPA